MTENKPEHTKVSLDLVVKNARILTSAATGPGEIASGCLAVKGDVLVHVGEELPPGAETAARIIDARGNLVMPGLVNTHTHAAMTCFRGLADDLSLMTWLNDHIFPAEAMLTEAMVYTGALFACIEMIRTGTTCFCDMYLFENAVARAADAAGLRAVVGEVLYDFPSPCYGPLENGYACTRDLIRAWKAHPRVSVAVEPHSPYLCAPELLTTAWEIAEAADARYVIHLSETESEVQQINARYGCTPVAHLASLGVLGPRTLACHGVHLTDRDQALLEQHGAAVAHNPQSNLKLASGVAPVTDLMARGIPVGLGTDGCASNNDLDMFTEMDTAAKLQKGRLQDPSVMPARDVVAMATRIGARALGLASVTGTLEPGKKADFIIIDMDQPHLTPVYDPYALIVHGVRGQDVVTTVVDGQVLMDNRKLTFLDEDAVRADIRQIADTMAAYR